MGADGSQSALREAGADDPLLQMIPFFSKLSPFLIGIEACGTSHFWARELVGLGHEVRLMPPAYVRPYVKRGKTDAGDAEAICEAVTRPTMRFVPVKSAEQQAALSLHRTWDLWVRQRTLLVNMIRGLLAEFGGAFPEGVGQALALARRVADGEIQELPALAAGVIKVLVEQVLEGHERIRKLDRELLVWHRSSELARSIATVPGVGLIGATALAASVTDPAQFRSGRQFATWLGLTPLQHSSGGKERLGRISKMGDQYLRRLLIAGMTSLARRNLHHPDRADPRINVLLARKPLRGPRSPWPTGRSGISWCGAMSTGHPRRPPPPETNDNLTDQRREKGARFRGCENDVK